MHVVAIVVLSNVDKLQKSRIWVCFSLNLVNTQNAGDAEGMNTIRVWSQKVHLFKWGLIEWIRVIEMCPWTGETGSPTPYFLLCLLAAWRWSTLFPDTLLFSMTFYIVTGPGTTRPIDHAQSHLNPRAKPPTFTSPSISGICYSGELTVCFTAVRILCGEIKDELAVVTFSHMTEHALFKGF